MIRITRSMLENLSQFGLHEAFWFFLALNAVIFTGSVVGCLVLARVYGGRRIFDRWEPWRGIEMAAALGSILLNAAISAAGWWLWKRGSIALVPSTVPRAALDCLVMILAMDLGMYAFHRLAHHPWVFALVHRFHHRHEATNPISLFVLHPAEVLGFGGLMLVFLVLYPMTLGGLLAFLFLNVAFGTLGHSGVEPFPERLRSVPVLRLVGTSTFHAGHHRTPGHNFGFYTLLWDQLFGTLHPDYDRQFRHPRPCSSDAS